MLLFCTRCYLRQKGDDNNSLNLVREFGIFSWHLYEWRCVCVLGPTYNSKADRVDIVKATIQLTIIWCRQVVARWILEQWIVILGLMEEIMHFGCFSVCGLVTSRALLLKPRDKSFGFTIYDMTSIYVVRMGFYFIYRKGNNFTFYFDICTSYFRTCEFLDPTPWWHD